MAAPDRAGEPITAEGHRGLREEIEDLEGPRRIAMAARIKVAREEGDLKENAEYHIAKEDQAHLETRIKRLRERLTTPSSSRSTSGRRRLRLRPQRRGQRPGRPQRRRARELNDLGPWSASTEVQTSPRSRLSEAESPIGRSACSAPRSDETPVEVETSARARGSPAGRAIEGKLGCALAYWRRASARPRPARRRGSQCASGEGGVSRRYHSASRAPLQPEPAAVTAWR